LRNRYFAMLSLLGVCGHCGRICPWDGAVGPVSTSPAHLLRERPDAARPESPLTAWVLTRDALLALQ
jgi:hypothetical protein